MKPIRWWLALLIAAVLAPKCLADVDLVTIPTREGTQLTIYNSEDITMVREHRLLTVKQGINRIQFSWANTLIDPTSIDFRILDHVDQVDLVDTTFPSGRNDALQWNIESRMAGKIPVEIRYFTSGITWKADYVGIANEDETKLNLTGYVRVFNNSGELYDNAETRMVVGTINLVEKIADLARRPAPGGWKTLEGREKDAYKREFDNAIEEGEVAAMRRMPAASEMPAPGVLQRPAQIVKQGLSEYFLFTIEGREDIKENEPKRLVALKAAEVPLECVYKLTDRERGDNFTKFYRFKNIKILDDDGEEKDLPAMENLGFSPLPDGMVRLYSEYENKDLAYVGGTETNHVPIGDRVEVSAGPEKDITITRRVKDQKIENVIARQYKGRIDDEFVLLYDQLDYDETFFYEEEIISGKPANVKVEIERKFDDGVYLWADDEPPKDWYDEDKGAYVDLHEVAGRKEWVDLFHVKYFLELSPGEKQVVSYTVTYKRRKAGPAFNQERRREPVPGWQPEPTPQTSAEAMIERPGRGGRGGMVPLLRESPGMTDGTAEEAPEDPWEGFFER